MEHAERRQPRFEPDEWALDPMKASLVNFYRSAGFSDREIDEMLVNEKKEGIEVEPPQPVHDQQAAPDPPTQDTQTPPER